MENEPNRSVAAGLKSTTAARLVSFALNAAFGIVLTRSLDAERLGVLAIALVAAAIIEATSSVGLSRYLVQRRTLDESCRSTIFWSDAAFGVIGGLAIAAAAPFVGKYYGEPEVVHLLLALALTSPITGLVKTHRNLAFRDMRFDLAARSQVMASSASTILAFAALLGGAGIWAVVFRELVVRFVAVVTIWRLVPWRPSLTFSTSAFREAFGFGSRLLLVEVLRTLAASVDQLIVARFGTARVGVYSRATTLVLTPLQQVTGIVATVLFPAFSRVESDEELASSYSQAMGMLTMVFGLLIAALVVCAHDAVLVVLGERWLGAVPIIQILAPTLAWKGFSEIIRSVYNSRGRTDLTLQTTIVGQVMLLTAVAVGSVGGVVGVAIGHTCGSAIGVAFELRIARKLLRVRFSGLVRQLIPIALPLGSALVGGCATRWLLQPGWLRLTLSGLAMCFVYVVVLEVSRVAVWDQFKRSLKRS